jgi:hypothetical protein
MPAVAGGALWLSGGRPPCGGTALRRWVGAIKMRSLSVEVARRFDDSREQVAALEKVLCGRLAPEYLLWNGRTR